MRRAGAPRPVDEHWRERLGNREELFDARGRSAAEIGEQVHRKVLQPTDFNASRPASPLDRRHELVRRRDTVRRREVRHGLGAPDPFSGV
jgi:hypothetical protein